MLSCRGKFKLFQGIQWINSIKVTSSCIPADQGVFVIEHLRLGQWAARDDTSVNCRQEWFDIFLILQTPDLLPTCVFSWRQEKCAVATGHRLGVLRPSGDGGERARAGAGDLVQSGQSDILHSQTCQWCHLLAGISGLCTGERNRR